jgi:hypothetical protein
VNVAEDVVMLQYRFILEQLVAELTLHLHRRNRQEMTLVHKYCTSTGTSRLCSQWQGEMDVQGQGEQQAQKALWINLQGQIFESGPPQWGQLKMEKTAGLFQGREETWLLHKTPDEGHGVVHVRRTNDSLTENQRAKRV